MQKKEYKLASACHEDDRYLYKIPAWSFLSGSSTCSKIIQLNRKKN